MRYWLNNLLVYLNALILGSAMHVVLAVAGVVFLGMPTIGKVTTYALALAEKGGVPPELAAGLALVAACLLGGAFAYLFVKVSADSFAVIGLASILATEALLNSWDNVTNGSLGITGIMRPEWMKEMAVFILFSAMIAIAVLLCEWLLLNTWVGRALRGYREDETAIQSMGVNIKKVVQNLIVAGSMVMGVAWVLYAWRVQLVTPEVSGINFLIEILTLVILASRPLVRDLVLASLFVYLMPELLRFLHFPETIFAQARVIAYALILIILILRIGEKIIPARRRI